LIKERTRNVSPKAHAQQVPIPAEQPEERRGDEEVREVLDRDVNRVLRPDEAALERREPGLHEEDERGRGEEPDEVDGVYVRGHAPTNLEC
jgi:hypothetical protein